MLLLLGCYGLDGEGFDWNEDINKTVNLLRRRIYLLSSLIQINYTLFQRMTAVATGSITKLVENIAVKIYPISANRTPKCSCMHTTN